MARLDLTEFDAMLKEIYPDIRVESLAKRNRPLLEWMPMRDTFYGDSYVVPVLYEDPQGRGTTLKKAVTNANTTKQTKFVSTERKKDYGAVQIESEAIMAASKDVGSFMRAKDAQISGMLRNLGKFLHVGMYRDTNRVIGTISSIGNGSGTNDKLTLTNKSDVYYFGEGQVLSFLDDSNSDAYITSDGSATATVTVEKVDLSAGTIEVDTNTAFSGGGGEDVASDDKIVADNDKGNSIAGLASWLPLTAETSGTFFSADRTKNVAALQGHRVNNTGRSILENGQELAMEIGEFGGEPDAWFMNPRAGLQLLEQVGAKVERMDGGKANVGFTGFELVNFITGPIKVIFDFGCPPNRAYMLQKDTWHFAHMGAVPHIIRDDGNSSLRDPDGDYDGIEVRGRYFGELFCEVPGFNGTMAVATS